MSDLNDCGFRSDWYAYIFVGSISAVVPADEDEKKVQITPEEVFLRRSTNSADGSNIARTLSSETDRRGPLAFFYAKKLVSPSSSTTTAMTAAPWLTPKSRSRRSAE